MSTLPSIPKPLRQIFALFPLHTHGPVASPYTASPVAAPTLWIHSPRNDNSDNEDLLSNDVECLKWQAYLALRGLSDVSVRWDVTQDGAIDGLLPNLHVPSKDGEQGGELLPAHLIPGWVDGRVGDVLGELEGYTDIAARDESRAWVSLMEGNVHAALVRLFPRWNIVEGDLDASFSFKMLSQPPPSVLDAILTPFPAKKRSLATVLTPPPPPLTGISSFIPPWGARVDPALVFTQYCEAIAALSERLGTDKWFLNSAAPTPLDALVFAYLHCFLHSKDRALRREVYNRENLVKWELGVQSQVRAAFRRHATASYA
ncbi:uncharacterized protein FIBRA_04321 [Fibroporia radiculosa]|uniref:Metaxin glutathione S-transferase domain-containing protein n=1 Tax=Fibroporia radiculosa TaxID=599839 RepID=J4GP16_9APHY|nr:uncharacterized protein FIBRA_04321 [Fibroporia radiculosa]CCM02240.1 predicted protein [Fibroporia radiculosa]